MDKKEVYSIALAGLIHDIGKFMQRAELEKDFPEIEKNYGDFCPFYKNSYFTHLHGAHTAFFIERFIPDGLFDKEILFNAARHHKNSDDDIFKKSDFISAEMDRYDEDYESESYKTARLLSIFDMIELKYKILDEKENINPRWAYNLYPISENQIESIFPMYYEKRDIESFELKRGVKEYKDLWSKFQTEIESLYNIKDIRFYFNEFYWLLEKYTWCIPSATTVLPDISLFDHLKTTSAISTALYHFNMSKESTKNQFCIYAGDISGIQNYIFRISQAQGIGGIAKRLRGRSFFINMLSETLARYIIETLGYTQTNINFCGGGNFELLLANTESTKTFLNDFEERVNSWLLKEYYGELGFIGANLEVSAEELKTKYNDCKKRINEKIDIIKQKKYKSFLNKLDFWIEAKAIQDRISICPSCNIKPIFHNEDICNSCYVDKRIGTVLPESKYINLRLKNDHKIYNDLSLATIDFNEFGCVELIGDLDKNLVINTLIKNSDFLYSISNDSYIKARYPIAKTLPYAIKKIDNLISEKDEEGDTIVYPNQTLSFTTLADMAEGDKRIGILKMDVDNLGLIFTNGFPEISKKDLVSISRISTLSRLLSNFFSFVIDSMCREIFDDWKNQTQWQHKDSISNIFYLTFSGGDDLLVIGPWDQIIELARKIRRRFKSFTCENPNISISAGIYICKPKYPISLGVEKANDALDQSKNKGKNRITVMGESFVWDEESINSRVFREEMKYEYASFLNSEIREEKIFLKDESDKKIVKTLTFEELLMFAKQLLEAYKDKKVSRRFIHRLLEAQEVFFRREYNLLKNREEEIHNYMFIPHLLYNIERNVKTEEKLNFKKILITEGNAEKYVRQAKFLCKYTLMKTRN